jgi:seryl-tRNA synthetase
MQNQSQYLDALLSHQILYDTGVDGLYGRSGLFEDIVARLGATISAAGRPEAAPVIHFTAGMNRVDFEKSGYLKSFPDMAGTVHCFCGDDAAHRKLVGQLEAKEDWTQSQMATDVALIPAACYPLYPIVSRMGAVPPDGRVFEILSHCYRHEPSRDPARMQMFRQREFVCFGSMDQVLAFRRTWVERGRNLAEVLGLACDVDLANDPFFGRTGRMLAANQREQELKFELLIGITSEKPTACMSFNYHQDHFGKAWDIHRHDGSFCHTGCVGFGMERLTLALFSVHGFDTTKWPATVRNVLWS